MEKFKDFKPWDTEGKYVILDSGKKFWVISIDGTCANLADTENGPRVGIARIWDIVSLAE